jgi:hypothetical protein
MGADPLPVLNVDTTNQGLMMITERSQAYARIMRTLRAFDSRAAACDEVARLREACATLAFAPSASPCDRHAMTDAIVALADLVARGCVHSELAAAIVEDLGRCAPPRAA